MRADDHLVCGRSADRVGCRFVRGECMDTAWRIPGCFPASADLHAAGSIKVHE